MSCVCHAFASVHCCLVVTCWEGADLLALVCDVELCFVTFPCGILGQVWYLIVSIPDVCRLSYLYYHFRLNFILSLTTFKTYIVPYDDIRYVDSFVRALECVLNQ